MGDGFIPVEVVVTLLAVTCTVVAVILHLGLGRRADPGHVPLPSQYESYPKRRAAQVKQKWLLLCLIAIGPLFIFGRHCVSTSRVERAAVPGVWLGEEGWFLREVRERLRPNGTADALSEGPFPAEGRWTRIEFREDGHFVVEHAKDGVRFASRTGRWTLDGDQIDLDFVTLNGTKHPAYLWFEEGPDKRPTWPTARMDGKDLILHQPLSGEDMTFQRPR